MLVNALRGHMAELGVISPQGIARVADLIAVLLGEDTTNVPALDRAAQGRSCRSGAQQQDHNRGGFSLLCLLRRRVSFVANTRWLRQYPLSRAMERSVLDWADGQLAGGLSGLRVSTSSQFRVRRRR